MSEVESDAREMVIEQEYEFDEPPEKLWRAVSRPEIREAWLPADALAEPAPTILEPGRSVSYRMRERTTPFLESTVRFEIASNGSGGTRLRVLHELNDTRSMQAPRAANGNAAYMLAA